LKIDYRKGVLSGREAYDTQFVELEHFGTKDLTKFSNISG